MLIEEIVVEGAVSTFAKQGNKTVRKYRCTTGSRKGRVVAKPSTCSAPKNVKRSTTLKRTKHKKGSAIKNKASRTKRSNPVSKRLVRLNTRRKGRGRKI